MNKNYFSQCLSCVFVSVILLMVISSCSGEKLEQPAKETYGKVLKHQFINYSAITKDSVARYEQLAAKGDAEAMFMLAHCYARGIWCDQDSLKAITLLRKAAVAGYYDAQMRMCEIYFGADLHLKRYASFDYSNPTNIKQTKDLAEKGVAWAQNLMGEFYDQGVGGFKEDQKKATQWYIKSANQGFGWGQANIGSHWYCFSDHVQENDRYYTLAAQQGCRIDKGDILSYEQMYQLYPIYDSYTKRDYTVNQDSVQKYQELAEGGDAFGEVMLGVCYLRGCGTDKNIERGLDLIKRSAQKGDAVANQLLGRIYESGDCGLIIKNEAEAEWYYYQSAMQGHPGSMVLLGRLTQNRAKSDYFFSQAYQRDSTDLWRVQTIGIHLYDNHRAGDAVKFLLRAVNLGSKDIGVKYRLGQCYYHGWNIYKNYQEALNIFRETEQNIPEARTYIGLCYENGTGVAQDMATAIDWYRKGEAAYHGLASYRLGLCYEYGRGVQRDMGKAAEYYQQAADRKVADAAMRLSEFYADGIGVVKDSVAAQKWRKTAEDLQPQVPQYDYDFDNEKSEWDRIKDKSSANAFFDGIGAILGTPRSWDMTKANFAVWFEKVNFFVLLLLFGLLCWLVWATVRGIYRLFKPKNRFEGKEFRVVFEDESDETWLFSDSHCLLVTDKDGVTKEHTYTLEKNGQLRINNYRDQDIALITLKYMDEKIKVNGKKLKKLKKFKLIVNEPDAYIFSNSEKYSHDEVSKAIALNEHVNILTKRLEKRSNLYRIIKNILLEISYWISLYSLMFIIIFALGADSLTPLRFLIPAFIISCPIYVFCLYYLNRVEKRIREGYHSKKNDSQIAAAPSQPSTENK